MGAAAVPVNVLVTALVQVPPRSQTVSPGCTLPWPPLSAVWRSHGWLEPSPLLDPPGRAYQPATTIGAGPAVPPYVATTVARPGRIAVTRPVCCPVLTTVATAGMRVPQSTCAATGWPPASRMVAVRFTVSPIINARTAGVTVTAKLPRVALIGTLPVTGINTSAIVGFVPG